MSALHKCADSECSYFGQAATRGCGCYKRDEQVLREQNAELLDALQFYADESGWNQPPVKTIAHELLGPAYENQASKIRLDRGKIARAAIAKAGAA